ncbi:hypothetical protein B0H10DRAFT_718709 [Mycena sp. CBHHK59/15]|nr:hypothetical protein B0H10DRAFT_718709 [Mycena sp. CBHHK59/15]
MASRVKPQFSLRYLSCDPSRPPLELIGNANVALRVLKLKLGKDVSAIRYTMTPAAPYRGRILENRPHPLVPMMIHNQRYSRTSLHRFGISPCSLSRDETWRGAISLVLSSHFARGVVGDAASLGERFRSKRAWMRLGTWICSDGAASLVLAVDRWKTGRARLGVGRAHEDASPGTLLFRGCPLGPLARTNGADTRGADVRLRIMTSHPRMRHVAADSGMQIRMRNAAEAKCGEHAPAL